MKIVEMHVTPVAFPDPPLRNSTGVHQPYAIRTIVELKTDDGLSGWGEAPGGEATVAELEAVRDAVIGLDPFHREPLRLRVTSPRIYSPLEVACFDLMGKASGRSVSDLLGGAVRDPVEFAAYLFYKFDCPDWGEVLSPETMVGEAKRFAREHGFTAFKVKGGVLPPDEEIETIRQMRRALGPEARLRLDPNSIWTVETSIRVGKALEEDLEYLEDPTRGMEGMAAVQRALATPLSTNAVVTRWEHIPEAVRTDAVRVVLSDHHYWGGLEATKQLSKVCEVFGLGLSMHSNSHLGISLAAMVHVAAATPHLTYACDTHYPWIKEDLLVGGNWRFTNGHLPVPKGPGLGIEIDRDRLAQLADDYRRCGITRRDDVTEMRRYVPDWQPLCPRW
jgi:glucarate dehydratase